MLFICCSTCTCCLMLITLSTFTRPTTSLPQRDTSFQYLTGWFNLLTPILYALVRFRHKSWEDEGLFGVDPPDTPSPSTFAFTNSRWFNVNRGKCNLLSSLIEHCNFAINIPKTKMIKNRFIINSSHLFSLGSLPTSQNCDSISLEQRFSLPLRQVLSFNGFNGSLKLICQLLKIAAHLPTQKVHYFNTGIGTFSRYSQLWASPRDIWRLSTNSEMCC